MRRGSINISESCGFISVPILCLFEETYGDVFTPNYGFGWSRSVVGFLLFGFYCVVGILKECPVGGNDHKCPRTIYCLCCAVA